MSRLPVCVQYRLILFVHFEEGEGFGQGGKEGRSEGLLLVMHQVITVIHHLMSSRFSNEIALNGFQNYRSPLPLPVRSRYSSGLMQQ